MSTWRPLSGSVHSDIPLDDAPAPGRRPETRVDLSVRSVSGNVEIGRALEHVADDWTIGPSAGGHGSDSGDGISRRT